MFLSHGFKGNSTEWFFFIIIIFRHVGWSDRHILQNEITCYISLMSLSSSFLCYWLCHISLWDFINFCIIILSWQGAFLLWFVEKFCEWSDPHLTDGDLWLSKVARWSVRLLVCGGAGPLVFWLGLFQARTILCVSQGSVVQMLQNYDSGALTSVIHLDLIWVWIVR